MTIAVINTDVDGIARDQRLAEIEQALKFDPDRDYRRQLIREYCDLTGPKFIPSQEAARS